MVSTDAYVVGGYHIDTALSLLGPRSIYADDEQPCCLAFCVSQVFQTIATFFLRLFNVICGDHQWYDNSVARTILEGYPLDADSSPELLAKVNDLYQALMVREERMEAVADKMFLLNYRSTTPPQPEPTHPRGVPQPNPGNGNPTIISPIEDEDRIEDVPDLSNPSDGGGNVLEAPLLELTCPIFQEPFDDAYILLEDGFTYEKDAIRESLRRQPNNSPYMNVQLLSATALPNNHGVKKQRCPITGKPFHEPYYCMETHCTYEKEAIIDLFKKNPRASSISVPTETSSKSFNRITLYPNKCLFTTGKIPKNQIPLTLYAGINVQNTVDGYNSYSSYNYFQISNRGIIFIYAGRIESRFHPGQQS